MIIPYNKIGKTLALFCPLNSRNFIRNFFNELLIKTTSESIRENQKNILKLLKSSKKLKVAFYVYDETKWKCQSIYDLMEKDEHFEPFIFATKNCATITNENYQTKENVKRVYNFFKQKNMNVVYGYDCEKEEFLSFEEFDTDIVFYQHPWYIHKKQDPITTSKFALTYYVPYFIANVSTFVEYGLDFHRYLHKHFVLNDIIQKFYSSKMKNKGKNLAVVGHPQLDYFYLNQNNNDKKEYVIYAPHWSINYANENYATFEWNGQHILNFAKQHPEIKWLFKPHPLLKKRLKSQELMTDKEIEEYWNEWDKIGLKYESGDYLDLFMKSRAMITDCGSFLTEFFLTKQPVILLVSKSSVGYNPSAQAIVKNYYQARNIEELDSLLNDVIINKNDLMKKQRENALSELGFENNYCAQNILNYLKDELGIK